MENKKKTIIFYILFTIAFLFAIFSWHNFSSYPKYNKINIIIETKTDNNDDILLRQNEKLYTFPKSKNILNFTIKNKIKELDILISKNHKNKIKNIAIFNDIKSYIFQDFSEFSKTEEKICQNNICKTYESYKIDKNLDNKRPVLEQFSSFILEFFKGNKIFLISYILFFISFLYFLNNKKHIKTHNLIIFLTLIITGIILRLNEINAFLPWGDENYSINITNSSFLNIFSDPGNPPFYYFILKIYNFIFNSNILSMRILSVFFGISTNIVLYLFLKKNTNEKAANIALLLLSINIVLIYYSQELRSYILQTFLSISTTYCIFEIIKNNKKFYPVYTILTLFSINTHYYQIFFIISTLIIFSCFLIKEKRYEDFKKVLLINLFAFISFCPYFIYTLNKNIILSESFNSHLEPLSLNLIINNLLFTFGGSLPLIFCLIFFIKNLFNKKISSKEKEILIYSMFIIFFVFLCAIVVSGLFKPIISQKYFSFLIPFFIIIISIIFSNIQNKFLFILSLILIFQTQNYFSKNFQNIRKKYSINQITSNFGQHFENKNTKKKIVLILKNSKTEPVTKTTENKKDIYYISPQNNSQNIEKETINLIETIKKNENVIILTSIFLPSKKNLNLPPNYTCFFNSATDLCVWKIE